MRHTSDSEIESLRDLMQHPGWELVAAHITKQTATALTSMRTATSVDKLAAAATAYMVLTDVANYPKLLLANFESTGTTRHKT